MRSSTVFPGAALMTHTTMRSRKRLSTDRDGARLRRLFLEQLEGRRMQAAHSKNPLFAPPR
jgi:hypothetical protein